MKLNITLEDGKIISIEKGSTFKDIIEMYYKEDMKNIALCTLNDKYYELVREVPESGELKRVHFDCDEGLNVYTRTLQFIFIKAALDIFKDSKITIEHSISKGLFGEIHKEKILSEDDIKEVYENN